MRKKNKNLIKKLNKFNEIFVYSSHFNIFIRTHPQIHTHAHNFQHAILTIMMEIHETATRTGSNKFVHCKFATTFQRDGLGEYAFKIWASCVHSHIARSADELKR